MSKRGWIILAILAVATLAAYFSGLTELVSFEALQSRRVELLAAVEARPVASAFAFFLAYSAVVALSIPAASIMTLLGGFLFGPLVGTAIIVMAATTGATVVFLIARTSLGESLRRKAGPLYNRVADGMRANAFEYLLFIRIVPLFPFFVVNILPALFEVRLRAFVAATFIGIIPGTFVYANLGRELGTITGLDDLISAQLLVSSALLGLVALIPVAYRKWKAGRLAKASAIEIAGLVLSGMFQIGSGEARAQAAAHDRFLSVYDALLEKHVAPAIRTGISYAGVDYQAWRLDPRHAEALTAILASDPATQNSSNAKLAYWINAYNLLTVDLIVREGETRSIKNLGSVFSSPWKAFKWTIAGREYSLDDIEHGVIRPMGEPRIHFAVNCAAISCPDLRFEAYRPADIDAQLADQMSLTFANPTKDLRVEGGDVFVSKVMDWYGEDFAGGNVSSWLSANSSTPVSAESRIRFLDYDWSLNSR